MTIKTKPQHHAEKCDGTGTGITCEYRIAVSGKCIYFVEGGCVKYD